MVNLGILERVFRIRFRGGTGTCFAIEKDSRQYLITAKHVIKGITEVDEIELQRDANWHRIKVRLVGLSDHADVGALAADHQLCPSNGVIPGAKGLCLAQDVFFLGFPYGLSVSGAFPSDSPMHGYPLSLVKKAAVSAIQPGEPAGMDFLLDGHNNPGFSGGPVVFDPPGRIHSNIPGTILNFRYKIAAIISGYKPAPLPVLVGEKHTGASVQYNTGIIVCANIAHAMKLIASNPIGAPIDLPDGPFEIPSSDEGQGEENPPG